MAVVLGHVPKGTEHGFDGGVGVDVGEERFGRFQVLETEANVRNLGDVAIHLDAPGDENDWDRDQSTSLRDCCRCGERNAC